MSDTPDHRRRRPLPGSGDSRPATHALDDYDYLVIARDPKPLADLEWSAWLRGVVGVAFEQSDFAPDDGRLLAVDLRAVRRLPEPVFAFRP